MGKAKQPVSINGVVFISPMAESKNTFALPMPEASPFTATSSTSLTRTAPPPCGDFGGSGGAGLGYLGGAGGLGCLFGSGSGSPPQLLTG